MSQPPPTIPARADVEAAADLRAAGCSWEAIARRLADWFAPAAVESWPAAYPDVWDPRFYATHRRLAAEAEAEGRAVLRQDLRQTRDKDRRDVAKKLIDHGRRTAPGGRQTSAASDVQNLVDHLEGLSHDDLRTHLEGLLAELEGGRGHDPGGPPVG
jgi:hypothetical protein